MFSTTQDWNKYIDQKGGHVRGSELRELRFGVYQRIEKLRGRPLLVYASDFLGQDDNSTSNAIDLSDIDGFTDLAGSVDGNEVDILLHSPGGRPDATERIVYILRNHFDKVHFIVPHSAYSAATMLALSGDTITIHPSATLGPIDPQIGGIPARSIKRGFEKVRDLLKEEGPEALPAYIPLIEKYSLDLLELCDDSEKLSKELVTDWLTEYMYSNEKKDVQIEEIVDYFSSYDKHLMHSRPLLFKKLKSLHLKIKIADKPLRKLIWEAYIMLNGFFNMTDFVKLYENAPDLSYGKQVQIETQQGATNKAAAGRKNFRL